jgi:hypothetical protein
VLIEAAMPTDNIRWPPPIGYGVKLANLDAAKMP